MPASQRYDNRTILLHWLTAGLIVVMWCLPNFINPLFPRPMRFIPISAHIVLGAALVCIYLARIVWRLTSGTRLPAAETGVMGLAGTFTHYALYALVAATLGIGLTYEAVRGDLIFQLVQIPSISPGNTTLRRSLAGWHELAANAILILAGLHAAAALYHRFIRKDAVLQRML